MPVATRNGQGDVVRELIGLIRSEGLAVGERLPSIRQLAVRLGVRPSAARDAVMRAQTMGLVKVEPRSGAYLRSLDYRPLVDALSDTLDTSLLQADPNLFHLLEARQLIETELAAQAASRRRLQDLLPVHDALSEMARVAAAGKRPEYVDHDIRFHLAIAEVAGNSVLAVTLKAILGLLRPFLCQLPFDATCRARTQQSHEAIYRALVDGDADAARGHVRQHMRFAYDNLLGQVQTVPGPRPRR